MPGGRAKGDRGVGGVRVPRRARAIVDIGDLRPTDRVLDVGCGEGRVALAVAGVVGHVHGLDIRRERVERAAQLAAQRSLANATFEVSAIEDHPFSPGSWDVVMFMRVWGRDEGSRRIGEQDLERVLRAARRQVFIQAGKPRSEQQVRQVMEICDANGFDVVWYISPSLIVANRRGTDARITVVPDRVLVSGPQESVLVRAEAAPHHPMVGTVHKGLRAAS